MALEISRFFDYTEESGNEYQADEFAEYFRMFLTDGVWDTGTNLQVTADGSGMQVKVGYGAAIVQGYGYWLKNDDTGAQALPIGAAPGSGARIDRVILRLNRSTEVQKIELAVIAGTPASSPTPPALVREGNVYDISLAQVRVAAGAAAIVAGNVTDERQNTAVCGLIEPRRVRDYLNQGVKTTDSPTFAEVTVTGTVTASKVIGAVYQ